MSSHFPAKSACIGRADARRLLPVFSYALAIGLTLVAATITLSACAPATTTKLAGADPADPAVAAKGVVYRSTVTPYTSLRPSTPSSWRERNEAVTPQRQPDR